MSALAREHLANHNGIIATLEQRSDLLDDKKTNTLLIAALLYLVGRGALVQFTAIHSDHHDDSALNPDDPCHSGTHAGGCNPDGSPTGGYAADFWFVRTHTENDWVPATDPLFGTWLSYLSQVPYLLQIGLAGSAVTDENLHAAGTTVFIDQGADHIHLGCA